jgi:hypothetical protein
MKLEERSLPVKAILPIPAPKTGGPFLMSRGSDGKKKARETIKTRLKHGAQQRQRSGHEGRSWFSTLRPAGSFSHCSVQLLADPDGASGCTAGRMRASRSRRSALDRARQAALKSQSPLYLVTRFADHAARG